jgi:flagellar biosynthetic protein FlhB
MAEDAPDRSSQTEDPTQKKLDDAHRKGDVVKSQEVTNWFMLAGSGLMLAALAPGVGASLGHSLSMLLANAGQIEVGSGGLAGLLNGLVSSVLVMALLPLLLLAAFAIAGNLVQHRPVLTLETIKPKFSKVNPIEGFKRLFSAEALVNFAKGLVKLALVAAVLWFVLWPEQARLEILVSSDPAVLLPEFVSLGLKIFGAVLAVVTVIALADYAWQRQRWWQRQKMTMREMRDEFKQSEGDPQIKGKIRQLRNERSRKRMMSQVPDSTVVITNPTHYAVALKYERGMAAPICLAKGVDAVALRIREAAKAHNVPIIENPPLARALFASVEIDAPIPGEHFKAVAQVIGYVMRLSGEKRWKA